MLDRVNKELVNHQEENLNSSKAIMDRLLRFLSDIKDLRDALNEAVNNTARAAELNSVNEKTLEENKVRSSLKPQKQRWVSVSDGCCVLFLSEEG